VSSAAADLRQFNSGNNSVKVVNAAVDNSNKKVIVVKS